MKVRAHISTIVLMFAVVCLFGCKRKTEPAKTEKNSSKPNVVQPVKVDNKDIEPKITETTKLDIKTIKPTTSAHRQSSLTARASSFSIMAIWPSEKSVIQFRKARRSALPTATPARNLTETPAFISTAHATTTLSWPVSSSRILLSQAR